MDRNNLPRSVALFLLSAMWLFLLLALGSFHATDWPSHAVEPNPPTQNLCSNAGAVIAYYSFLVTGQGGRVAREETDRALALVGIGHRRDHFPRELSGGEQQRTAIARALVNRPRILIADEPTGNLDPVTSWEIIKLLVRVNELGTTVIIATHYADIVNALRRRVVALDHGRVVRDEREGVYAA